MHEQYRNKDNGHIFDSIALSKSAEAEGYPYPTTRDPPVWPYSKAEATRAG